MRLRASVLALLFATVLQGCYVYGVALDIDHRTGTGCQVEVNDASGERTLQGIDAVALTVALHRDLLAEGVFGGLDPNNLPFDPNDPNTPELWTVSSLVGTCGAGDDGFDILTVEPDVAPVGINNGFGATDTVEFRVPRSVFQGETLALATFVSSYIFQGLGETLVDQPVLTLPHLADADHHSDASQTFLLNLGPGTQAPAMSLFGLLALVSLLLFLANRKMTGTLRGVTSVALVAALLGVAYAATITIDGNVTDWDGIPMLGLDATGDSSLNDPAEDIVATFATFDDDFVYFRLDINDIEAGNFETSVP